MKAKILIIATILVMASSIFAQERSKFSTQVAFDMQLHFDDTPYENNWLGAFSYSSSIKLIYNPTRGKFMYTLGLGQTHWLSSLRFGDMAEFVEYTGLNFMADPDEDLRVSKIRYTPKYIDLQLGARHLLVDVEWFQLYQDLELINHIKQSDEVEMIYRLHTPNNDIFNSTSSVLIEDHPTKPQFLEKHGDAASNHILELKYNFGFKFTIKRRVGIGAKIHINKSLYVEESIVTSKYWGVGLGFNLQYNF